MEPMKVSFGFSKLSKRPNLITNTLKVAEKKVELIECLEGQSIKVKDAIEEVKQPLVIPLKDNQKNLLDRVKEAKKHIRAKKDELEDIRPDSELTIDELAARELMKEAKDRLANGSSTNNSKVSVLPINENAESLEGEKESTLEDYESVPISDYGVALLRGMGWKEGMPIGKNSSKSASVSIPELRPKGLGLGATKVVQAEMPAKKAVDKDGNELVLVKSGFAKVIAGPQKGNYCEVQGFDEEAGRVIVKVYPRLEVVNINELMLIPVTKEEFSKGSKILNNAKYEEYKDISDKKLDSYRVKSESRQIKEEIKNTHSDSEKEKHSTKNEKKIDSIQKDHKSRDRSESPQKSSKYRERSKSPSKHRESRDSDRHNRKSKRKEQKKSRSRSVERHSSSKYKSKKDKSRDRSVSSTSSDEEYSKERKVRKEKEESTSKSRNKSEHISKKDKEKHYSSDERHYEKDKKGKKHTKSKHRDRSRSKSRDKSKKSKKHSSQRRESSDSDADYKKEKRKKNKCKSRHRRNSSSSSEDRRYKSKR